MIQTRFPRIRPILWVALLFGAASLGPQSSPAVGQEPSIRPRAIGPQPCLKPRFEPTTRVQQTPPPALDATLSAYEAGYESYRAGKLAEAEQHLQEALRADPNLVKAHYWLGKVYSERGLLIEARHHWEEVLRLERLIADRRAALRFRNNEYPALEQIRRSISRQEQAQTAFAKGTNFLQEGHWAGAIAEFKEAVRLFPGEKSYVLALARALRDSGNPVAAAGAYSHVVSLPRLTRAEILESVEFAAAHGNRQIPVQILREWVAGNPEDTTARRQLAGLERLPPQSPPVTAGRVVQRLRGQVVLDIGLDNGLKLADEFTLNLKAIRAGPPITDPATGDSLGRMPDTTTADLLITKVNARSSWALIKREFGPGVKEGDLIESNGRPPQGPR